MIIINLLLLKIVMNDMIAICNGFFKIWEKQFQSKNIIYSTDFYFLIDAIASLSYSVLRAMMPWDTRPYARSGGERNPSTATVSVTRQKQTHRSYPEHHPYSTATITSATAQPPGRERIPFTPHTLPTGLINTRISPRVRSRPLFPPMTPTATRRKFRRPRENGKPPTTR